tara:strand:- start:504 stop:2732 length:2229 start_codon:yes stop_codon:yes gene_type:complete
MSAFSFAGGFAKRLGERQDAERKAKAAALEQEAEDERYLKRIALSNQGKLAVEQLKIKAEQDAAEKELTVNDFIINNKNYNPFGNEALSNTNKGFFFAGGLDRLRNMTDKEKAIMNEYIANYPNDAQVQKFMSNVSGGGTAWLAGNTTVTQDGKQIRKLAFDKTGINVLDDFIFTSLTSEDYRARQKRLSKYDTELFAYSTDNGQSYFINAPDKIPQNADKDSIFKIDKTFFGEEKIANRYEEAIKNSKNGSVPRLLYEGASLYNLLQTEGASSQKVAELFTEFIDPKNNANFRISSLPESEYKDYELKFLNDNPIEGRWVTDDRMIVDVIEGYTLRNYDFDGRSVVSGPEPVDNDFLEGLRALNQFTDAFGTYSARLKNIDANILDLRGAGVPFVTPGTYGEAIQKWILGAIPQGENVSPLFKNAADNITEMLKGMLGDVQNITEAVIRYDDNDTFSARSFYSKSGNEGEDNKRLARARELGINLDQKFTRAEYNEYVESIKGIKDIRKKMLAGQALSPLERRKATLISMAYTYASFIQGGSGGTRTVSDADVLFALRALGAESFDAGLNTNTMNDVIRIFDDKVKDITRRGISNNFITKNSSDLSRPKEVKDVVDRIIQNVGENDIRSYNAYVGGNDLYIADIRLQDAMIRNSVTYSQREAEEQVWEQYSTNEELRNQIEEEYTALTKIDAKSSIIIDKVQNLIETYRILAGASSSASQEQKAEFNDKIKQLRAKLPKAK